MDQGGMSALMFAPSGSKGLIRINRRGVGKRFVPAARGGCCLQPGRNGARPGPFR